MLRVADKGDRRRLAIRRMPELKNTSHLIEPNKQQTAITLNPESHAYQHALSVWMNFHAASKRLMRNDESAPEANSPETLLGLVLPILPPGERRAAAIGTFVRFGGGWSPIRQSTFLGELIPGPNAAERRLLEAAARGAISRPQRIPVTLEEFPSRIWKRAMASGSMDRLAAAAHLASQAALRLLGLYSGQDTLDDLANLHSPLGDVPQLIDLLALPPGDTAHLKNRIFDCINEAIEAGRFQPAFKDLASIKAWSLVDAEAGVPLFAELVSEMQDTAAKRTKNGTLSRPYDTRRLGRLMLRFGARRHSYSCAKALGDSPWSVGWQFQIVSPAFHTRIRKLILRPEIDQDRWKKEPALACSAMTIPLWLSDGEARVTELTAIFKQADECPWLFPRLQAIYQWHLALGGKTKALEEIGQFAPELALGLPAKR